MELNLITTEPSLRLDSKPTNRFTMDKDGVIYDSDTDQFVCDNPAIRVSKYLPWAYGAATPDLVWDAPRALKLRLEDRVSCACSLGLFFVYSLSKKN